MKKITCLLLAMAVGFSALLSGVSAQAAEKDTETVKHIIVLDPGHGGAQDGAYAVHNGKAYREEEINWKIANYTMQALSQSPDIEVHLTRSKNQTMNLVERVNVAKRYDADLLVSQHIDDSESSAVHGASVLLSRGTYRPAIAAKEKKFADFVLKELNNLGITTRGLVYRMSEDGSKYPNGKARDYYGIVAQSVEQNIPGVIVEHGFVSSPYDAIHFFSTDARLKKIGEADARAIIQYCRQVPAKKHSSITPDVSDGSDKFTGWKEKKGYYYYYINSVRQRNRILNLEDGIYYVNREGQRQYGWQTVDRNKYFFQKDGRAARGWLKVSGKWYYFHKKHAYMYRNCTAQTSSGKKYIFNSRGVCTNRK